jgi:hypothetical protein
LPNGVAQTVPESDLLSTVNRSLWHACLSNVCRSPRPRPRLPVRVASHTAYRVKAAQVVLGMVGARLYSLDTICYTWATAREAASLVTMGQGDPRVRS